MRNAKYYQIIIMSAEITDLCEAFKFPLSNFHLQVTKKEKCSRITGVMNVKLGTELDHKHSFKFCMKYCSPVKKYKLEMVSNSDEFKTDKI
jgi:hypothetical protein